ncbi:MAG: flagellar outer dynein arm light chain 8 [Olpidium bornovanus]|uniref:Dynein light chain n=1 Tax=Olpidium bornovanus TaxID=278681 RepID=A0A8H7ZUH0_9FUNG|nr:MAG: flagellar outer dynein arm light chain 8 [Olpidium bornovanus]
MSEKKAVIKNADMAEEKQQDAVDCATQALEKYNVEKDIAAFIKREFDKKYTPTWHCIVGRNFGSYVTHGRFAVFFLPACFLWWRGPGGARSSPPPPSKRSARGT